jgi:hypothetical protein
VGADGSIWGCGMIDTTKHCKIIKDMDEKIMNGERLCADLIQTLTALRDVVAQSEAHNRKMADRVNSMKKQVDAWKWSNSKLIEEIDTQKGVLQLVSSNYKQDMRIANRRVGIWRSKVERLKAKGAN